MRAAVVLGFVLAVAGAGAACDDGDGDGAGDGGDGPAADAGPPTPDARLVDGDAAPPWQPAPGTSWQWQLSGTIDTSVDVTMYDVDLVDTPQATIDALRGAGRVVICYFSAGSWEAWRPDAAAFPAAVLGNALDGWPGEKWLDIRDATVRALLISRLDLAQARRCDGVEPDNVDGYSNDTGFALSAADQLDFNRFLAAAAHARGLSIGLKNDVDQLATLVADFDWALNEECHAYAECGTYLPFAAAGKAVFHVEYGVESLAATVCPATKPLGFSTLIERLELDAWRVACP